MDAPLIDGLLPLSWWPSPVGVLAMSMLAMLILAIAVAPGPEVAPVKPKPPHVLVFPERPTVRPGYYLAYALAGDGSVAYEGTVTVLEPRPNVFTVQWSMGYTGIGTLDGGKLVIGWSGAGAKGVSIGRPTESGWLFRQLILPGDGSMVEEHWEFMRALKGKPP